MEILHGLWAHASWDAPPAGVYQNTRSMTVDITFSINGGLPQNGWFTRGYAFKMNDLGYPNFRNLPY